jgi:hypothetical protein
MKRFALYALVLVVIGLGLSTSYAQTYDLQFVLAQNDGVVYAATAQIRSNLSTFGMGGASLFFTYDSSAIGTPVLDAALNFSGGLYSAATLTAVTGNRVSINIEYLGASGNGTTVPASYIDIARIRFTTKKVSGHSSLAWRTGQPNTNVSVFKDDNATLVAPGTLFGLDNSPLPIQLSSFVASVASAGHAGLRWTTLSEINNYGFEVQKAADKSAAFQSISGSFTAGNGTTTVKHDYSYVDNSYATGNVYRLKQLDLDGTLHFSDAADPLAVTGVSVKALPTEYSLSQNYPNPFNPSTVIEFALPKDAHVTLEVYNIIGQKVMTLVDEVQPAGYHSVKFDGTSLASGMYLYRLATGQQTFLKKLLLMK